MFLASTCSDDPKNSQQGRVFACPLVNQKVSEPFEILASAVEIDSNFYGLKSKQHLLKGHENIELHFPNSATLIVTGYKKFEVTKVQEGESKDELMTNSEVVS